MTRIEAPVRLTVEEANKRFEPESYVMVHCEVQRGASIAGLVIAHAPLDEKGELVDFAWALPNETYGDVSVNDTVDLFDGEAIWVELHSIEAE